MITQSRSTGMVTYNRRQRGLIANVSSALLQPVAFYRSFPLSRQWMWVAAFILVITGFSAVHQPDVSDANTGGDVNSVSMPPMDMQGGGGVALGPEGGFVLPPDAGGPAGTDTAPNVSRTAMTALLAAAGVLLAWLIQAFLLCEVSLINGVRPSMGRNLQIAIWASVPLALMLVIQQVYFAIGGSPGQMGLSLLLEKWAGFQTLPTFSQNVLTILTTNFTLFWLWNLALLYLGGRYLLNGRRTAVMLVIVAWIIISTFVPALTSPQADASVSAGDEQFSSEMMPEMMPGDLSEDMLNVTPEAGDYAPSLDEPRGDSSVDESADKAPLRVIPGGRVGG